MSLRPEEIDRLKYELGVSVIRLGAEPYLSYLAVFDKVIQPYLYDNSTTSVTPVVTSTAGAPVAITLANNPAPPNNVGLTFQVGTNILVDVGPLQETTTVLALSGLVATVNLYFAHGTGGVAYPVAPLGSEQIIRDILSRLSTIASELATIAPRTAGVAKVDEVELVASAKGRRASTDKFDVLIRQREQARNDLGEAVGYPNLRKVKYGGGFNFEIY